MAKKKTNMFGIKGVDKKICHVENDKKKGFFAKKNVCWIKDDRDSVTRQKMKIEKIKNEI